MAGNRIDIYLYYGALRAGTGSQDMQNSQWNVAGCRRARPHKPKKCSRRNGQVSQCWIYHLGPCRYLWSCRGLYWAFRHSLPEQERQNIQALTKWVPEPQRITQQIAQASVERSLKRMGVSSLDLVQFHWWDYNNPY